MRNAIVLLACLVLTGDTAGEAHTRLEAKRLGSAPLLQFGGDGTRFAAWPTLDQAGTVVYDVRSGGRKVVARPAGCGPPVVGSGALLYTCDGRFPGIGTARLIDLRTGVERPVVGDPPSVSGFTPSRTFVAAGARWLQATIGDYHVTSSRFFSRATGTEYDGPSPFGLRARPDLDSDRLRVALCSPLVARPTDDPSDGYVPPQVDGRFALDVLGSGFPQETKVVLRQCGTKRHRVVCRTWCASPVLDRGQVFWADDFGVLHVLDVRARHARTYVIPGHPVTAVHPFGRRLIVGTDSLFGEARVQVRVTRRPGAARTLRRP